MRVLIELYDRQRPFNNVITGLAMKPKRLVVMGDRSIEREECRRSIVNTFEIGSPGTEIEWQTHTSAGFQPVCGRLRTVIETYGAENCVVDVTGGSEILLMAVGRILCDYAGLPVIAFRTGRLRFEQLAGDSLAIEAMPLPEFSIAQIIAMHGGELLRNGRGAEQRDSEAILALLPDLFGITRRRHTEWTRCALYFQQVFKPDYMPDAMTVSAPVSVANGKMIIECPLGILYELNKADIVGNLTFNAHTVSFTLPCPEMKGCLLDVGLNLELHVYSALRQSAVFDEVDMSCVISWDDDGIAENNVLNEIDVIAIAGIGHFFISCKTGSVDTPVLNELATLTRRFGGEYATPVLVTLRDVKNTPMARRAEDMGVVLIGGAEVEGPALIRKLTELACRYLVPAES